MDAPGASRNCLRMPPQVLRVQGLVAGPGPPGHVPMLPRGPVEVPALPVDHVGHQVRQVLVLRVQGRPCEQAPQELIRMGPAHHARLQEQEQVPARLGSSSRILMTLSHSSRACWSTPLCRIHHFSVRHLWICCRYCHSQYSKAGSSRYFSQPRVVKVASGGMKPGAASGAV